MLPSPRTTSPLVVLLVAEDRQVLRHLSKALVAFGYEAWQAADQETALKAIDVKRPDFLLVDADERRHEALQLCRIASAKDCAAGPSIFLIAASLAASDLTEALEAGVDDFLAKPIVYGELLARLARRHGCGNSIAGRENRPAWRL